MIVSASYRTDIPAFYGRWFRERLDAGFADVVNPYGGQVHRVTLTRDAVDAFLFWTRNAAPFLPAREEVSGAGFPFCIHLTITGYPRALETSVTDADDAVSLAHALARRYGPRTVVWRYDPVLITDLTPPDWHRRTFARLTHLLRGATDEVVTSFAQIYRKTRRNLGDAARRHGFAWRDPEAEEKRAILQGLAALAAEAGMAFTLCTQPNLLVPGAEAARCIDLGRLSDIAGRPIAGHTKGNRPGCLCAESRDIGTYDTCPHGCAYCYAVSSRRAAKDTFKAHDPDALSLGRNRPVATIIDP